MWMSLMSWLRSWPRIGNRCPPLIAKQYLTRFSRITRAINSPPSAFAMTELLLQKLFRLHRILAHLMRRRKARAQDDTGVARCTVAKCSIRVDRRLQDCQL